MLFTAYTDFCTRLHDVYKLVTSYCNGKIYIISSCGNIEHWTHILIFWFEDKWFQGENLTIIILSNRYSLSEILNIDYLQSNQTVLSAYTTNCHNFINPGFRPDVFIVMKVLSSVYFELPSGSRSLVRPSLSSATSKELLRLYKALDFCSFSYWIKSGLKIKEILH